MRRASHLSLSLSILVVAASVVAASPLPRFSDYPASQAFTGRPIPADFNSAPRVIRFAARIREGARRGPNFAGGYTIVSWGCGTGCESFVIVNAATGEIYVAEAGAAAGIEYRLDSSLLVVDPISRELLGDGRAPEWLVTRYYQWDGKELSLIAESKAVFGDEGAAAAGAPEPPAPPIIALYNGTKAGEQRIAWIDGAWHAQVRGDPVAVSAADLDEGYLEFVDPGTGAGTTSISAALYPSDGGGPVLAELRVTETAGQCPDTTYELAMHRSTGGTSIPAADVVPALPLTQFFAEGYDPARAAPALVAQQDYRVGFRLQPGGDSLQAFLDVGAVSCGLAVFGEQMPREVRETYRDFLDHARTEPLALRWNPAAARFDAPAGR